VFHRLPPRAQKRVRRALLLVTAAAVVMLVPPVASMLVEWPVEWSRESPEQRLAWGFGPHHNHLTRVNHMPDTGPRPGETGSASKGELLAEGSFGLGGWVRSKRDVYYGKGGPDHELDINHLGQYRRVTAETRADAWLDPWRCAALLLLPAILVLLNALRRYVAYGYWFAGRTGY
jgi:hypothetical protein